MSFGGVSIIFSRRSLAGPCVEDPLPTIEGVEVFSHMVADRCSGIKGVLMSCGYLGDEVKVHEANVKITSSMYKRVFTQEKKNVQQKKQKKKKKQ